MWSCSPVSSLVLLLFGGKLSEDRGSRGFKGAVEPAKDGEREDSLAVFGPFVPPMRRSATDQVQIVGVGTYSLLGDRLIAASSSARCRGSSSELGAWPNIIAPISP